MKCNFGRALVRIFWVRPFNPMNTRRRCLAPHPPEQPLPSHPPHRLRGPAAIPIREMRSHLLGYQVEPDLELVAEELLVSFGVNGVRRRQALLLNRFRKSLDAIVTNAAKVLCHDSQSCKVGD